MDKLEQVIKDVELGLRIAKGTDCGLFKTSVKSAEQILELLKEKQPKKVKDFQYLADLFVGKCPSCGEELNNEVYPAFCGFCGQRISWKAGEQE